MTNLKNIFKLAELNGKTNGMTYKEFKLKMKLISAPNRNLVAKSYFYMKSTPPALEDDNMLLREQPTLNTPRVIHLVSNPETLYAKEPYYLNEVKPVGLLPIEPRSGVPATKSLYDDPWAYPSLGGANIGINNSAKVLLNVSGPKTLVPNDPKLFKPLPDITFDTLYKDGLERNKWNVPDGMFGRLSGQSERRIKLFIKDHYNIDLTNMSLRDFLGKNEYSRLYTYIDDGYVPLTKEQRIRRQQEIASATPYVRTSIRKTGGKMNKFQQGGQVLQEQLLKEQIFAMIDLLPEEAIKQLLLNGANSEQIIRIVLEGEQSGKIRSEVAQAIYQMFTQAAKHGAKLNYIKSLKNQCAEDEELYYFKKGGSVGCGCKKKNGGELNKEVKKESAVDRFKKMSKGGLTPEKKPITTPKDSIKLDPKTTKKLPNGKYPSNWNDEDKMIWERENGPKDEGAHHAREIKKDCGGSKLKLKKGDKVCPKCGKVHKAGIGCSVAKFKYRKLGGLL